MTKNKITIKLVLIRHGKTPGNESHRYIGRTDEELSEAGKRELLQAKKAGSYPDSADVLFVSPLKRCTQTAELLYPDLLPVLVADWREIDFGAFEGKNYEELNGRADYQAWIDSNGTLPFPGGESREAFAARCKSGFYDMLCEAGRRVAEKQSLTVVCIVHGGTIMALLSMLGLGDYFSFQCANGGGYQATLLAERSLEPEHFLAIECADLQKLQEICQ